MSTSELSGTWTYRIFNPTFVTGNQTPQEDALIRAEADLTLKTPSSPTGLEGTIEWPGGGLDLKGMIAVFDTETLTQSFDIVGTGRRETDGWEYHYYGHQTPWWPQGVEQRPTLVGSVIRVKPHASSDDGTSPAGEVFSFIAMKPRLRSATSIDIIRSEWVLTGSWTYRSFRNNPTYPYLTAPPTAHGLILQEAVFNLRTPTSTTLQGTIEWTGGVLDIGLPHSEAAIVLRREKQWMVLPAEGPQPPRFWFGGIGRSGTQTDGWEYEYHGYLTRQWSNGIDQRPALVGSVIRLKPHGDSPAGYVYPFIAVKQPSR
jgi:hypothetical protein